jgi:SNF family Na+-dependent transporter
MYTRCSRPAIPFSFNPVKILEGDLLQGLTLQELGFPTADVNKVVNALELAYRIMSACYLVGVILAGLTIVTGLLGLYASRLTETVSWVLATLGSICLVVASVIGTVLATRVVDVINQKAKDINVVADKSTKYLGITWAAVGTLLVATIVWMAVCCCGTHRSNRDPKAKWNRRSY